MQDFHLADGFEGHGDVHVVVAALHVVEAQAVEQDEGLAEVAAANGHVGLHAIGAARLEIERRVEAEQIGEGIGDEIHAPRRQQGEGAIHFIEREGFEGAGDDDGIMLHLWLGLLLSQAEGKRKGE